MEYRERGRPCFFFQRNLDLAVYFLEKWSSGKFENLPRTDKPFIMQTLCTMIPLLHK